MMKLCYGHWKVSAFYINVLGRFKYDPASTRALQNFYVMENC